MHCRHMVKMSAEQEYCTWGYETKTDNNFPHNSAEYGIKNPGIC